MAHLIDKDALVAEIEKQQRKICVLSQSNDVELRKDAAIQNGVYCSLLSLLDTLEAKEVDLEKEIHDYHITKKPTVWFNTLEEIAKHFFELGLKTKQG